MLSMNNNKAVIIVILVGLLLVGGVLYFLSSGKKTAPVQPKPQIAQEEVIPTIAPSDIGLEFKASPDKRYVKFIIAKAEGIDAIEYDISYNAISEEGTVVNQGLTGELSQDDAQNGTIETEYRELGTCSTGGKCRFDKGVKEVKLTLKITKTDGKVFMAEKDLSLE